MSSENEEIIRRAYQRAEDKDIKAWVNSFTPDGTFTDQSIGVLYRGPDELATGRVDGVPRLHRFLGITRRLFA